MVEPAKKRSSERSLSGFGRSDSKVERALSSFGMSDLVISKSARNYSLALRHAFKMIPERSTISMIASSRVASTGQVPRISRGARKDGFARINSLKIAGF